MRFRRKDAGRKPELNLASMIDATFLLLSFFIFTTGQAQNESRLSPNLRVQQGTDVADDLEPQVLEVLRVGEQVVFRLGSRDCPDRAELVASLRALAAGAGVLEQGLFVRVYPGVDVGAAAAAIQVARDVGFKEVTYVPAK
jgi:biopolymer transport protein ExbD